MEVPTVAKSMVEETSDNEMCREIAFLENLKLEGQFVNLPKSNEFVTNSRGQKIHLRTYWPVGKCEAITFFLHGYTSHGSGPPQTYISKELIENHIAYVAIDFHGHGYSDGDKAYISNHYDLLDDVFSVIKLLYSKVAPLSFLENYNNCNENNNNDENNSNTNNTISENTNSIVTEEAETATETAKTAGSFNVNIFAPDVPFFLKGQSMGGGVALLSGYTLQQIAEGTASDVELDTFFGKACAERSAENLAAAQLIASKFAGCILFAPAISVNSPPNFLVKWLLDYVIVPLWGIESAPSFLIPPSETDVQWIYPDYINYIRSDAYPANPEGLKWGKTIRFGTAASIIQLSLNAQAILPFVRFPFIVLHDPEDSITAIDGSRALMQLSQTAPNCKVFVPLQGGRHDLLANRCEEGIETAKRFITNILAIRKEAENKETETETTENQTD